MPALENGEKLLEVQLLRPAGYINDFVRVPGFQPVRQSRQVRGRVIEGAVALLDERRI